MRTFATILYTLAGLYMVYWVIRIQEERYPYLLLPTILVLIIVFGYILYKYVWPNLRRTRKTTLSKSNKPARKTKTGSKGSPKS
jgi:peptidoglycan/LPS O-acetylase OafA/YrhL